MANEYATLALSSAKKRGKELGEEVAKASVAFAFGVIEDTIEGSATKLDDAALGILATAKTAALSAIEKINSED